MGRPSLRTPEVERKIIEGLSKGIPLSVICSPDEMPAYRTVKDWIDADAKFSAAIAHAREEGFDTIALEAIAIADMSTGDTIETKFGPIPDKEWIMRSKLRVETRLKLLAKWDPKRYGDRIAQEISGPGGGPIQSESTIRSTEEQAEFARLVAAAQKELG